MSKDEVDSLSVGDFVIFTFDGKEYYHVILAIYDYGLIRPPNKFFDMFSIQQNRYIKNMSNTELMEMRWEIVNV